MARRFTLRGALIVNVLLLVLGIASWLIAKPGSPAPSQPAAQIRAARAAPILGPPAAPLQVPAPQLQLPPPAPAPLPQIVAPAPATAPTVKLRDDVMAAVSASSAQRAGVIVEIEGLGKVVESNPDEMLTPASAQKLRTAGVALLKLGPDFRFRTDVLGRGGLTPDGVFRGDLLLVGGGDPALTRADLGTLAASVHAAGIRAVEGGLWGDESRYDGFRGGPAWKPDYLTHESGTLSALALDGNDYRDDPGFIANPVTSNVEIFRQVLQGAGIAVNGPTRAGRPEGDLQLITSHYSQPLAALVGIMVRESDNFFAEMILKELGRTAGNPSTRGGADVVETTARSLGVPAGEVHDGSGLSPLNRQSAANEILWLRAMDALTIRPVLRSSLAVSCAAPGTLKKRFCGTPAAGQVFAKTGALPHTAVLVGYTNTASGKPARFSFVLSGNGSNRQARDAIDRAVSAIREYRG